MRRRSYEPSISERIERDDVMRNSSSVCVALIVGFMAVGKSGHAADMAAPMPVKAPPLAMAEFNWSGFYLGAHAGYLFGRSRVFDNGVLTEPGAPTEGGVGGLLAGYNWQSGSLLLGLEADFGWANAVGHGTAPPPPAPPPPPEPNTYRLRWDSHVVGRLGYASGHWLVFATGGLAIANFSFQEGVVVGAPPEPRLSATYVGYSVGAGVEYAFTHNLVGRVQYIYDNFGSKSFATPGGDIYRVDLTGHTARAALAWKF